MANSQFMLYVDNYIILVIIIIICNVIIIINIINISSWFSFLAIC